LAKLFNLDLKRSERFQARIALERSILDVVNSGERFQPLAGLTLAAIEDWKRRAPHGGRTPSVDRIVDVLTAIARASGLAMDQSRAVFDPGNSLINARVGELKQELRILVSQT